MRACLSKGPCLRATKPRRRDTEASAQEARAGFPVRAVTSTIRTAGCGPACPVVWQGDIPYADWAAEKDNVA